jgi:hypothetical protein
MAPADGVHSDASRAPLPEHMFGRPSQGCTVNWLTQTTFARRLQLSRALAALLPLAALPPMSHLLVMHLSDALRTAG